MEMLFRAVLERYGLMAPNYQRRPLMLWGEGFLDDPPESSKVHAATRRFATVRARLLDASS